jgi:hypothetical protein
VITPRDITDALRRDDLAPLHACDIDVLDTVDEPWRRGEYETEEVALVCDLSDLDAARPYQALVVCDDYDPEEGASWVYVPLSMGPVRAALPIEKPCDLCRTYTPADLLEKTDVGLLSLVCAPCAVEIRADDEDPTDHEARDACELA